MYVSIVFSCSFNHASIHFSSVQLLSNVWLFVTPWTAAFQASLSITNSWSLLKLMSIQLVMPSNRLILCRPLRLPPSIFPSIRVFSNESALCIRWPKYWSFSFSIHPSNEYSGLISFGIGWSDLLAVQGTLKSLLQHHSSKSSILRLSAFFRGGCRNWLLNGRRPLSILNSLGAYLLGGWNTMAWWRQHPLIPDMVGNILLTGWRKLEWLKGFASLDWFIPPWIGLGHFELV